MKYWLEFLKEHLGLTPSEKKGLFLLLSLFLLGVLFSMISHFSSDTTQETVVLLSNV